VARDLEEARRADKDGRQGVDLRQPGPDVPRRSSTPWPSTRRRSARPERRATSSTSAGWSTPAVGSRTSLCDPPSARAHVQSLDNVVGIDPGIRNAAFMFKGFDDDNVCLTYDELLLQDATVADYAVAVALKLAHWGLRGEVRWHAQQILRNGSRRA
jgi:hypothetical protein